MIRTEHDPQLVTRILFENFPLWMMVVFYILAISTLIIFTYGCFIQIRKYSRGQPFNLQDIKQKVFSMIKDLITHRTLKRRDTKAGLMHAFIFFSFIILFIATITITIEYDILEPLIGFRFWYGNFYLWFSLIVDIAGLCFAIALIYMMYRRKWLALPKLNYNRPDRNVDDPDYDRSWYRLEDWLFLWILLLIIITGYILEADRLVWLQNNPTVWDYRWWSPVGAILANFMQWLNITAEGAEVFRYFLWWFHGLIAFTFIALLPFTKIKHIFTAIVSLMLRNQQSAANLPMVNLNADKIGIRKITDLTWKQLLHADACTKCGRCHEVCPANISGFPLSPRDLILSIREMSNNLLQKKLLPDDNLLAITGSGINMLKPETIWSCRTCGACQEICPVGIEHVPIIVETRRALLEEGEMESSVQTALQNLHKKGNSIGENKRKRPAWTKKLDFSIKDARKESVDLLWFVGDYASFDPRYQKVCQSFARILQASNVDFGLLFESEMSAGNDVRRVGEEGLFEHLAQNNIETLETCDFKQIVTTDPHSFNTLKNEYPDFGGKFDVIHATQLMNQMLTDNKIPLVRKLNRKVTYHDSCHLGRLNKEYEAPRKVLSSIGIEIIEMPRNRDNSFCCGAGGGRIWMADPMDAEKPSELRIKEAACIKDIDAFVVNCPKCMNMFEDAVKSTNNSDRLQVVEIIELIEECLAND